MSRGLMTTTEFQSTHSQGVRHSVESSQYLVPYFNPRTHKECDESPDVMLGNLEKFQSTHSQGVRPDFTNELGLKGKFQSTHSQGVRRA